jgi:hypothetical protein
MANGLTARANTWVPQLPFRTPSLRQLESADPAGWYERTFVTLLDRFLSLWSDADPHFAPMMAEAKERLERLRAGSR